MLIKVLLLTLDVTVYYDAAVAAHDSTLFQAAWTHCEIRFNILSGCYLVWHQILIILCVRICPQIHQEPSDILRAAHGCEVERRVALFICDIRLGPMLQEELKNFVAAVMTCSFEQRGALVGVHLVYVGVSDNKTLTDLQILLHAGKGKRALASISYDSWVGTEREEQAHDLKVIVDRGFHKARQT